MNEGVVDGTWREERRGVWRSDLIQIRRDADLKFAPGRGSPGSARMSSIRGADFAPAARLSCRFGAASVPAAFVNATTVGCTSEALALYHY